MANAYVSVTSDVLDDGHYLVAVAQTGPDTADVDVEKWKLGGDYLQPCESDEAHSLTHVRVGSGGTVVTCKTTVTIVFMSITHDITMTLSKAGQAPSLTVEGQTYPLSAKDHADVDAFLKASNFPIG